MVVVVHQQLQRPADHLDATHWCTNQTTTVRRRASCCLQIAGCCLLFVQGWQMQQAQQRVEAYLKALCSAFAVSATSRWSSTLASTKAAAEFHPNMVPMSVACTMLARLWPTRSHGVRLSLLLLDSCSHDGTAASLALVAVSELTGSEQPNMGRMSLPSTRCRGAGCQRFTAAASSCRRNARTCT